MNSSVKFFDPIVSVVEAFAGLRWICLLTAASSRGAGVALSESPDPPQPATARASRSGAATRRSTRRLSRARQTASAGAPRLLGKAGLLEVALGGLRGLLLV